MDNLYKRYFRAERPFCGQWAVDSETGKEVLIDIDSNKVVLERINSEIIEPQEK